MGIYIAAADTEVELADRVLETTQTTGTGAYSLDGVSVDGRQSFVAGIGSGNTTVYTTEMGTSWETGVGTVTAGAPDTLSRDFILESSNSGNAVSWSAGVKNIFCSAPSALLASAAYIEAANVFTAIQTIDTNTDDVNAFKIKNAAGVEVFRGRVGTGADGVLELRTSGDTTTAVLNAQNLSNRASLTLDGFEIYTLGESLQTPKTLTGTSVDFTVRSDARRITVMFGSGCSSNGTSPWLIRLGDSGGVETTSYASTVATATGDTTATSTAGFRIQESVAAAQNYTGDATLVRFSPSTHEWYCRSNLDGVQHGTGVKTLSATITTVRITTTNGTDSFDGGTVNVLVE